MLELTFFSQRLCLFQPLPCYRLRLARYLKPTSPISSEAMTAHPHKRRSLSHNLRAYGALPDEKRFSSLQSTSSATQFQHYRLLNLDSRSSIYSTYFSSAFGILFFPKLLLSALNMFYSKETVCVMLITFFHHE